MKTEVLFISILVIFCKSVCVVAFLPHVQPKVLTDIKSQSLLHIRGGSTQLRLVLNPAAASILAGSIAGAVGVGVAFPLDTLKTKSQILGQTVTPVKDEDISTSSASSVTMNVNQMNMIQLFVFIYKMEGISGFFGGVKGMMIGQALIKSTAFSANSMALTYLTNHSDLLPHSVSLVISAMFAGFVTSFLVAPIERIKVMMQASNAYKNELDCARTIIQTSGLIGLFSRGLVPTLWREIPSYGMYFYLYAVLMQTPLAGSLGPAAPLVFGALTGMACWIPVYPIDVVKTLVQNSDGADKANSIEIAQKLYQERGIGGFFDGLSPKMLRAAVNHSVTFYVYDILMTTLTK